MATRERLRNARRAPHQLRFSDAVWLAPIAALANRSD